LPWARVFFPIRPQTTDRRLQSIGGGQPSVVGDLFSKGGKDVFFNPRYHTRKYPDARSRDMMLKTIDFFECKGKAKIKEDDRNRTWYADLLEFQKRERLFATLLTPTGYGDADARRDTWRNIEFNEILAFYGLAYWYTCQVSILGLGPIWQSANEGLKRKAAQLLREGEVFAFGLSERKHGADVYSTEMSLTPQSDGTYRANGEKYYIGNGNIAPMVSTFGKFANTGEYVFFAADYRNRNFDLIQNVCNSQSYVANFALRDYPITEADILSKGQAAWDAALNTVNIGKYNLGWASIGICTHAFYEAINHAANRKLYGMFVTDFLLALAELFALVLYGQLILENVKHYGVDNDTLDQILDCLVRDLSKFALQLYSKPSSTPAQMDFCLKMIRKPIVDAARYDRVWRNSVDALKGAYEMNP